MCREPGIQKDLWFDDLYLVWEDRLWRQPISVRIDGNLRCSTLCGHF